MSTPVTFLCLECHQPAENRCSACKKGYFCSRSCQKINLQEHLNPCRLGGVLQIKQTDQKAEAVMIADGNNEVMEEEYIFGDAQAVITLKNCHFTAKREIVFFGKALQIENCTFEAQKITLISLDGMDGHVGLEPDGVLEIAQGFKSKDFSCTGHTVLAKKTEGLEILAGVLEKRVMTSNLEALLL